LLDEKKKAGIVAEEKLEAEVHGSRYIRAKEMRARQNLLTMPRPGMTEKGKVIGSNPTWKLRRRRELRRELCPWSKKITFQYTNAIEEPKMPREARIYGWTRHAKC